MFRSRKWQLGMGAVVALLVVPLLVAMGNDQSDTADDGALARDAQSYADDYGVSVAEARQRLELQIEAGRLGAALTANEGETFGGLWIEHRPRFKVKVGFTGGGDETLSQYEKSADLAGAIESVVVDTMLGGLIGVQGSSKTAISRTSIAAELGVNVAENFVDVYTPDEQALKDALDDQGAELPSKARIKEVSALSSPAHGSEIHGGEDLTTCTSGFSVKNSSGTQGITTAGHCQPNQSRGRTALTHEDEWWGGSYDLQWHTAPSSINVRNLAFDGANHRYIHSGRHWDDQSAGEYVCKYGKITHGGCGTIETKYYQISPQTGNKWVLVANPGVHLAEHGDSGGPFFSGNVAYGILTHKVDIDKAIYMAFSFIENQGLSLDTD